MLAVAIACSAGVAGADQWDKKTRLTVNSPIEVPGAVLAPGEYVMKLVDSEAHRHVVRFYTKNERQVISTVIAIPNRRLRPTGDTQFAWYETPQGAPPAMRAWFYPGDNFGQEFVYPEGRAGQIAQQSGRETAAVADDAVTKQSDPAELRDLEITAVTPELEHEEVVIAQQHNQELDVREPYVPDVAPVVARPEQLPETAGFAPLLALIGLGSLGGAAALSRFRRK